MQVKIGDAIVWADQMDVPVLNRGTVTQVNGDACWVDGKHRPEDCLYSAFVWPARVEEELVAVLTERWKLRRAYDASMGLVYQLQNRITRGEA